MIKHILVDEYGLDRFHERLNMIFDTYQITRDCVISITQGSYPTDAPFKDNTKYYASIIYDDVMSIEKYRASVEKAENEIYRHYQVQLAELLLPNHRDLYEVARDNKMKHIESTDASEFERKLNEVKDELGDHIIATIDHSTNGVMIADIIYW